MMHLRPSYLSSVFLLSCLISSNIASPLSGEATTTLPIQTFNLTNITVRPTPPTTYTFNNVTYHLSDSNKEVIDYNNDFMDALHFVQTEKQAGSSGSNKVESILAKHHNNDELYQYLLELSRTYPDITRLYSIGESVEGRKLWVLEITEDPGKHKPLKPEFKYVANIHGNEVVGRELLLHLARLLVENYRAAQEEPLGDKRPTSAKFVRKLLKSTRIHLLPSMNPDGYANSEPGCKYEDKSRKGRVNSNNVDLNRNFPDSILHNEPDSGTQPEVRAVMDWSKSIPFVLSANLHGGALVVSYPYDGVANASSIPEYRATPDDDVFKKVSKIYSSSHPTMSNQRICYDECTDYHKETFKEGITNGAQWYPLYGGMQDWIYDNTNALEVTIEVGCNQYPPESMLPQYWEYNKRALMNYIKQVHRGFKGIINDAVTGNPLSNVTIHVINRAHNVTSDRMGDYYRVLVPGFYEVLYEKPNYFSQKVFLTITDYMAQIVNIKMQPMNTTEGQHNLSGESLDAGMYEIPNKDDSKSGSNSLAVANLVMTIIIVLILLAMIGVYVVQKKQFPRSRSLNLEMRSTGGGTVGTGVSLPVHQHHQAVGSSTTHVSS